MKKYLLMIMVLFLSGCKTTKEEIKELKTEVNSLKEKVVDKNDLVFEISALKEQIKNLQKQPNEDVNEKIETLQRQVFLLKNSLQKRPIQKNNIEGQKILLKITKLEKECNNLKKEINDLNQSVGKLNIKVFKPTVFITNKKAPVYNSKNVIVFVWDKHTTFTSYIKKGDRLKITGYFVNGKFKSALYKDWWINAYDAEKKFKKKKR